jgi:signal transduction histidine kinase
MLVRPLMVVVFLGEILPALNDRPRPSLHGAGLPILLALATSALIVTALVARPQLSQDDNTLGRRRLITLLIVLAVAGNAVDALQGDNGALIGLTLVVWMAAANLERGAALASSALTMIPALVIIASVDHSPALPILYTVLTTSLFFLIAHAGARNRRELARNELLVAELADLHDVAADTAALAERGRIAREMHDVLAHSLSGLAIQLEAASLMGRREGVSDSLQGALGRGRRLAHDGLDEARRAIDALRGERVPGPDALPRLVDDFGRDAEIEVTLRIDGQRRALPAEAALTVYRVTQEALTNIARHSRAGRATVQLIYEPQRTRVVIADDGAGPRRENSPPRILATGEAHGYGISAMRERAALLDGTVMAGATEDGFRVELVLPVELAGGVAAGGEFAEGRS